MLGTAQTFVGSGWVSCLLIFSVTENHLLLEKKKKKKKKKKQCKGDNKIFLSYLRVLFSRFVFDNKNWKG